MLKSVYLPLLSLVMLSSCMKGQKVDLVIHNAKIHVMDDANSVQEAMAIRDGKIVEVGPERQILNKYRYDEEIDALGKDVYPGLTDAHGHLLMYANQKLGVDLSDAKSMDEVIYRCEKYLAKSPNQFIIGGGWDQSLWANDSMPDNKKLSTVFKHIPVCLYRIDGHAALVNDYLMKQAKLSNRSIDGGEVCVKNGEPTGLLIDNAIQLVSTKLPSYSSSQIKSAILDIQEELFQFGITGVHEAGIDFQHIRLFESMIKKKQLKLEVYAMLLNSPENKSFAKKHGPYRYKNLSIRSFKVFADGALGSRGALLKKPYEDDPHHQGLLLTPIDEMKKMAQFCLRYGYQLNTHGIGDSANALILDVYKPAFQRNPDHRFRIEHAQVIDPIDFSKFAEYAVFPSIQPTHATSDHRWAEKRLGKQRLVGAYAYRSLLQQYGMLAVGTDFPIEKTNPFYTIHSAVQRSNYLGEPNPAFLPKESLTLDEVLRGMTIWAAFASFQERELGSLEKGKKANFVIFDKPIVSQPIYEQNYAWRTFIAGKMVFALDEL
ncbi:MAG: amidohydrolase [Flavobacteriales bacterium]